jgi:hypothetical protein
MFRLDAIVAKWSDNLEFQGPEVWHEQIRYSTGFDAGITLGTFREMPRNKLRQLRLTVRANSGLKLLKWHTAAVYSSKGICDVIDKLLHSSAV